MIHIERVNLTSDFISLAVAGMNGIIEAYIIPETATILEKKDFLSIRCLKQMSYGTVLEIAKRILGEPFDFEITLGNQIHHVVRKEELEGEKDDE